MSDQPDPPSGSVIPLSLRALWRKLRLTSRPSNTPLSSIPTGVFPCLGHQRLWPQVREWVSTISLLRLPWNDYALKPLIDQYCSQIGRLLNSFARPSNPEQIDRMGWILSMAPHWTPHERTHLHARLRKFRIHLQTQLESLKLPTDDPQFSVETLIQLAEDAWHRIYCGRVEGTRMQCVCFSDECDLFITQEGRSFFHSSAKKDGKHSLKKLGSSSVATASCLLHQPEESIWNVFPPQQADQFSQEYVLLGQGNYAQVFLARHPQLLLLSSPSSSSSEHRDNRVAIKVYHADQPRCIWTRDNEIQALRTLPPHPGIVRLIQIFANALVLEWVPGETLLSLVQQQICLSETLSRSFFKQMCLAADHAHRHGVVHLDIKLENFLVYIPSSGCPMEEYQIKLVDWGFSSPWIPDRFQRIYCGSPHYVGPEILHKLGYLGPEADIWSLGVCLYIMKTGLMPEVGVYHDMPRKFRSLFPPPPGSSSLSVDLSGPPSPRFIPSRMIEFLLFVLRPRLDERPNMLQILSHPWLTHRLLSSTSLRNLFAQSRTLSLRRRSQSLNAGLG